MEVLEGIYTRRSIRRFTGDPVPREQVVEIIRAGTWAPSGMNNQPWRFVVVRDSGLRGQMARLTKYGRIIEEANACVVVLADKDSMYHKVKDYQAIGACIQNMLLAAHSLGLGAVWLGEILRSSGGVLTLLGLPEELELMAVVAVGHPARRERRSRRKAVSQVLLKEL